MSDHGEPQRHPEEHETRHSSGQGGAAAGQTSEAARGRQVWERPAAIWTCCSQVRGESRQQASKQASEPSSPPATLHLELGGMGGMCVQPKGSHVRNRNN